MTQNGYEALKELLHRLKTVERPKNVKEIEEARSHGDISENAEFHAAKERQSYLAAQIAITEDKVARAQVIDPSGQTPDRIRFGATVLLEDTESSEEVRYRIVGEDEADIKASMVSIHSPVARALIGKAVGDFAVVQAPGGEIEYEILAVRYE